MQVQRPYRPEPLVRVRAAPPTVRQLSTVPRPKGPEFDACDVAPRRARPPGAGVHVPPPRRTGAARSHRAPGARSAARWSGCWRKEAVRTGGSRTRVLENRRGGGPPHRICRKLRTTDRSSPCGGSLADADALTRLRSGRRVRAVPVVVTLLCLDRLGPRRFHRTRVQCLEYGAHPTRRHAKQRERKQATGTQGLEHRLSTYQRRHPNESAARLSDAVGHPAGRGTHRALPHGPVPGGDGNR
jgi:hypothetical protein